jgi:hypothetical protein
MYKTRLELEIGIVVDVYAQWLTLHVKSNIKSLPQQRRQNLLRCHGRTINYPSLNKQDTIEQERGRSHEEGLVQIFMLYNMQLEGF